MSPRLLTALSDGAIAVPDTGRIAVIRPTTAHDLDALPRDRVQVIQGYKPNHDAFAQAGYDVTVSADGRFAATLICVPRSKAQTRGLIAQAAAQTDGPIWIDGQKNDGIESILRDIKKRGTVGPVVSKAHGKLFGVSGGDFSDWSIKPGQVEGFRTVPGVFSADGIDPASRMLAQALPPKLPGRMADLGAGWGYLSRAALTREGLKELHLVEAEHLALDCARANIDDERATFHWADARLFQPDRGLDGVLMNPPFHQGRSADPSLGKAFIAAAARVLAPHGKLWMVANRHLPYETVAADVFQNVAEIGGDKRFKILAAEKPRRQRR